MPRRAALLACLLLGSPLSAAPLPPEHAPAAAFFSRAQALLAAHRAHLDRLLPPAEATAQRLLAGGHWYLAGNPLWVAEGCNRSAGPQGMAPLLVPAGVQAGDVVWLAYSASDYLPQMNLGESLTQRGALVIYFGPWGPRRPQNASDWLDSFTGRDHSANFILLGNILSLWTETAEVAAATARHGRTLVFLQSHVIWGATKREALYQSATFHTGLPAMAPVVGGQLARAYLDYLTARVNDLRANALGAILQVGRDLAQRAAGGRPAALSADGGHILPGLAQSGGGPFRYRDRQAAAKSDGFLQRGDRLIFFGYVSVPLDLWAAVHRAGATAVWIEAPLPGDIDFSRAGDTVIDQGWRIGDAAIAVPGYDMRILPPSGVLELILYEALMAEAGRPKGVVTGRPSP